ncbi:MAG: SDR family NAD(P)-dependent oxidoreductase [Nevskia sp.]|nr:SDR family NAD(P)-dependent oxidoreductase [Nevskia sp.]
MTKTALVTGGSSGLGLAMAKALRSQGYDLLLIARDRDRLIQAKGALEAIGTGKVWIYSCDISDEDALMRTFEAICEQFQLIDLLVLNAGVATVDLLADYKNLSDITKNVQINLLGAMSTAYLASPLLKAGSRILFISSGFGLVGSAGYSLYAAAKGGINNFADALRREMLPRKVSVHLACPGDIDTPMLEGELKSMPDWIRQKMGRAKAMPPDRAAAYILEKCFKGQFMIILSGDVKLLILIQRLLPRGVAMYLIDRILPLPPSENEFVKSQLSKSAA